MVVVAMPQAYILHANLSTPGLVLGELAALLVGSPSEGRRLHGSCPVGLRAEHEVDDCPRDHGAPRPERILGHSPVPFDQYFTGKGNRNPPKSPSQVVVDAH